MIEDNCANGVILTKSEESVRGNVESSDAILQQLRISNSSRIILGHININSFRNKLEMLSFIVSGKMDILIISESKLDDSFPSAQLHINGFSPPYIYDRNRFGGGVLTYIWEDITSKELKGSYSSGNIESISVEINLYRNGSLGEPTILIKTPCFSLKRVKEMLDASDVKLRYFCSIR